MAVWSVRLCPELTLHTQGPKRSRILATLYKDERATKLSLFTMLEKSFLDRIIRKEEAAAFEKELKVRSQWEVER